MCPPQSGESARTPERQSTIGDTDIDEPELPPGSRVGRYMIVQRLGEGGMGVVFLAYDDELERRAAVKFLRRRVGSGALLREAQILARTSHPNVVQVYEVGRLEGRTFVAMEYVPGPTLRRWLVQERPDWRRIVRMYVEAGRGLAAAHAQGIVHRDFKPDNVIVGSDARPRVVDFGIARDGGIDVPATGDSGSQSYRGGMGTLPYMAPEQFERATEDPRSDQYAFCVSLHEALFGARPFADATATSLQRAKAELDAAPYPAESDVPHAIWAAIMRGLKPRPEDRWSSMDALLGALERRGGKRWVAWAAAIAIVSVAAVVVADRDEGDPCQASARAVRAQWNADRRAEIGDALRDTRVAFADSTSARVSAHLDAYAATLERALVEQCPARDTDPRHDRAMACLAERREGLGAAIESLRGADATTVERAIAVVSSLPAIADCADAARLDADVAPPRDGEQARSVEALRRTLAQARLLVESGRAGAARPILEHALRDAAEIDYAPVRAEAQHLDAEMRENAGEPWASVAASDERAHELATSCGHERVAAFAAASLIGVYGVELDDPEAGHRWRRYGEALVERPGADPQVRPLVRLSAARLYRAEGRLDDAERELLQARAELEALYGPEHPRVATAVHNLANVEQQRGRLGAAVALYEEALALRIEAFGDDHPEVATASSNLGAALLHLERFDEAEAQLDRAIALLEASDGEHGERLANAVSNRAGVAVRRGDHERARSLYERAVALRSRLLAADHPELLRERANLAMVWLSVGAFDKAVPELQRIETDIGERGPALLRVGNAVNLAMALRGLDRIDEAEVTVARAVEAATTELGATHPTTALALYEYGIVLAAKERHADALAIWRKCVHAFEAAGTRGETWLWARLGLAVALARTGHDDDAIAELVAIERDLVSPENDDVRADVQRELAALTARRVGSPEIRSGPRPDARPGEHTPPRPP